MANVKDFTKKTTIEDNAAAVLVDQSSNAGSIIDLDTLADKVLDKLTSKTFTNQVGGSSAATLLAQLSTLNSNTVQSVNGSKDANLSLYNCTGTLSHNLHYRLNGHILYMFGRIHIIDFQKTGGNPGVEVTIPGSKSLDGGVNVGVGGLVSVGSHIYATENVSVLGDDGASVFRLRATESKTNITGTGDLTMLVPPFFVRVK